MERSKDISEKALMRQLADERRDTRKQELKERNTKIAKMIELGCSYEDIGRRYGVSKNTISKMVYDGKLGPGINARFGGSNSSGRACFVLDPPEN